MAPLFTLTTDYGSASSYPAQVKAIILSAIPDARIVDVTHDVPAFDVLAAALILEAAKRLVADRSTAEQARLAAEEARLTQRVVGFEEFRRRHA